MMDNDDELLKILAAADAFQRECGVPADKRMFGKVATRIHELKAERDEAVTQMIEAKLANKGVAEGTHVIVPVEPTEAMLEAGARLLGHPGKWKETAHGCYSAMTRTAQDSDDG